MLLTELSPGKSSTTTAGPLCLVFWDAKVDEDDDDANDRCDTEKM